ncbi:unnamed protein product [Hymenolepis diminuta]|uniref:CIA30 domain-containing protein n=1 Tax=Hymenolepis diminuta TaxID=6216 RepID=A0A0R3SK35_HYMDI|nr:unnamed protein product [Hymenolepis diminuta]
MLIWDLSIAMVAESYFCGKQPSEVQVEQLQWAQTRSGRLNLLGAGSRVIKEALAPGGDSPLHSGVLKLATGSQWACSGAQIKFRVFSAVTVVGSSRAVAAGSDEIKNTKLTWRWVQGDQGGSGSRWRLTIALRCVEACDGLTMGLLGRTVFESGEAFG